MNVKADTRKKFQRIEIPSLLWVKKQRLFYLVSTSHVRLGYELMKLGQSCKRRGNISAFVLGHHYIVYPVMWTSSAHKHIENIDHSFLKNVSLIVSTSFKYFLQLNIIRFFYTSIKHNDLHRHLRHHKIKSSRMTNMREIFDSTRGLQC